MNEPIVAQEGTDVKPGYIFGDPPSEGCSYDGCIEPVFRDSGLCWDHFIEEEDVKWDAQDAERETCLAGIGLS